MKNLLLIFIFFGLGTVGVAQVQTIGTKNGTVETKGRFKVDSAITLPKDTVQLTLADSGALAYKNGLYWTWNGTVWDTLATGGTGATSRNFANTDLTADSNRIHNWAGHTLEINTAPQIKMLSDTFLFKTKRGSVEIANQRFTLANSILSTSIADFGEDSTNIYNDADNGSDIFTISNDYIANHNSTHYSIERRYTYDSLVYNITTPSVTFTSYSNFQVRDITSLRPGRIPYNAILHDRYLGTYITLIPGAITRYDFTVTVGTAASYGLRFVINFTGRGRGITHIVADPDSTSTAPTNLLTMVGDTVKVAPIDIAGGLATKWGVAGNGALGISNFLGTTDTQAIRFRVNNEPFGIFHWRSGVGIVENIGMGYHALGSASLLAADNFAAGERSMEVNAGSNNVAIGGLTMVNQTSGGGNIAIGYSGLHDNTTGTINTAVGYGSLTSNTTASFNTAVGSNTLLDNTTGAQNVAIGSGALESNIASDFNTAVGVSALKFSTGTRNTAVGLSSLQGISTGVNNTAIGEDTRVNNNGSYNTMLGNRAGYNSTGDSSIFIGPSAGYNSTGNSKLYIANNPTTPLIYGDFSSSYLNIGGGAVIDSSAVLVDFVSNRKGILFPRLTAVKMRTMSSPVLGEVVYCIDSTGLFIKVPGTDTAWARLGTGGGSSSGGSGVLQVDLRWGIIGNPVSINSGGTGTVAVDSNVLSAKYLRLNDSTLANRITAHTALINTANTNIATKQAVLSGTGYSKFTTAPAVSYVATIPIADGGTGQATANAALNALLPTQAANAGKNLRTNATNTSWVTALDSMHVLNDSTLIQHFSDGSTKTISFTSALGVDSITLRHDSLLSSIGATTIFRGSVEADDNDITIEHLLGDSTAGSEVKAKGVVSPFQLDTAYTMPLGVRLTIVNLTKDMTVTGVAFNIFKGFVGSVATSGKFMGFGLYQYNPADGTALKVAQRANEDALWATAGWNEKAFDAPVVLTKGIYYLLSSYNYGAVAAPTVIPMISGGRPFVNLTTVKHRYKFGAMLAGQRVGTITSMPSNVTVGNPTFYTPVTDNYGFFLY